MSETSTEKETNRSYELECPYPGDPYVTPESASPREASAWLIEHCVDNHPGGLDPTVVAAVKEVTGRFKQPI